MNLSYIDRLQARLDQTGSYLVAGCDPVIEQFPTFVRRDSAPQALDHFYDTVLPALAAVVPAIKPNIAFFEQYGLAGLQSYARLLKKAKASGLLVIGDIKRGDIGSTAEAYAKAHLGATDFEVDAVTVSPFLGFDTLEVFISACERFSKGMYVLTKTSNPGAATLQGSIEEQNSATGKVAQFLAAQHHRLLGRCGYSGLGAVVGATYPDESRKLRALMPRNCFLIPGFGAQGGSAAEAVAGFAEAPASAQVATPGAALVNASRALLSGFPPEVESDEVLVEVVRSRALALSAQLTEAVTRGRTPS